MRLSEAELWRRIETLNGRTIKSIEQGALSEITEITGSLVKRRNPITSRKGTSAHRKQIATMYGVLSRKGIIVQEDLEENLGPAVRRRNGRFILTVLAEALPGQIAPFKRGNPWVPNRSGLRTI